jgi:biotin carboxylase
MTATGWVRLQPEQSSRPPLLLIGSGDPNFRRYALEDLASRYSVWLLAPSQPTWAREYLTGYATAEPTDLAGAVVLARELAGASGVAGVLSYTETLVELACLLAAELGLPGSSTAAVSAARDKYQVRRRLEQYGIPQPAFAAVSTVPEALRELEKIGYPAVLKPRRLAGSAAVLRVDGPDEVSRLFDVPAQARFDNVDNPGEDLVLIEQYLVGEEISVDSSCRAGVVTPLVIARKEVGLEPYFEELAHTVSADDPLYRSAELRELLQEIHRALGLDNLMTHTEFRLTPDGIRLVELNVRMGGGLIPYLGQLALGVSLPLVAAAIAVGSASPAEGKSAGTCARIELFYPPHDLVVESIGTGAGRLEEGVHDVVITKQVGSTLLLPPAGNSAMCRYGYVIVTGASPGQCRQIAGRARTAVHLAGRPPAGQNTDEGTRP